MSTDLVIADSERFLPTVAANFAQTWAEEMGDDQPEFPRVKIPAGGGTAWEIPTGDPDNPDVAKEITGVIVAHHPTSRLYLDKFEDRNSDSTGRPDAWSLDGKTQIVPEETIQKAKDRGLPVPSEDLASCPYNQFGSAHLVGGSGNGKASRNYHEVYVYLGGESVFPIQISIPATSIKAFKSYLSTALLARGFKPSNALTTFALKKVQSGGGIDYSSVVFKFGGSFDVSVREKLDAYSAEIKALVRRDPFAALAASVSAPSSNVSETVAASVGGDDFDF